MSRNPPPVDDLEVVRRPSTSFRDPSGYVFTHDNRIFRAVESQHFDLLRPLLQSAPLSDLQASRALIPTAVVQDHQLLEVLVARHPGYSFLEHERLDVISYPYEWSVSMLADAGVLTLDLQLSLLESGLSLKDGSAYNVQFQGSRPVFVDITSIERSLDPGLWYALGQFQRMFTFPLLLTRYRGWDLKSYFLGASDGRSEQDVARAWGKLARWRPALVLDVTLPDFLGSRIVPHIQPRTGSIRSHDGFPQRANLSRLRTKVTKLARGYAMTGPWAKYRPVDSYAAGADSDKRRLLDTFLATHRPSRVLDVGCNVGEYSVMAARHGARVVAIDSDHDAIEVLYRRIRETPTSVTPLVVDVTNPSPAGGVQYGERLRFSDRVRSDCVLALALMHHLLISARLSLTLVRDALLELTDDYLVLEFIPSSDSMFVRLAATRRELHEVPSLADTRRSFAERCSIEHEEAIGESGRTLLFLRKR